MIPIQTRGDVRRLIQRAEAAASVLRTPGHRLVGTGERAALADLLDAFTTLMRRRFDPEWELEPDQYLGGEDIITDLFGGAA